MATYSTNLALTLLATGEGAGTWGNTTNTNLGTLLEQAISGYDTQSLTSGVTLTLTIPNGATGVARNMYLEFTGNGSTVIVPSNKKLYFVYNNCSSGTITMKVAGQTGVTVAKGAKQILVSNGTDIQEAITAGVDGETTVSITALGVNAGTALTSGSAIVTMGYNAGTAITNGFGLTVIGHNAGAALTSNLYTTAVGAEAGSQFAKSSNNYFGYAAGRNMNSSDNCGFGLLSVRGDGAGATGTGNCGFGNETLTPLTTGANNTAIGTFAGTTITTGSGNTLVGKSAQTGSASASNRIVIGQSVTGTADNRITIGSSTNIAELDLDGSDTSWAASSDERLKENIQSCDIGLSLITSLRPVTYQWKKCKDIDPSVPGYVPEYDDEGKYNPQSDERVHGDGDSVYYGFIAQESEAAIAANNADVMRMVKQRDDGIYTVAPATLIPALVKAIQELKAEFDEYKRTHP
jgi:hypothetical protein